ncbi:FAD-dependent oxidoreductase [Curtobacterium pusillum]|uniref:NAD(P)-binding protein n=1 Tax=Curtobacterium pusillum TaxID=69373 RepID=A0ABX2MC54_9MICO|nr:FAD-dependent oxidoreductase [Curtobacterium pusillum]NUU15565.1 NAD(P)-binding protein [Curtobacterium pusillum]GLK32715.1 FAD-dependent oxidoreductase [Curtobacterium pusillum]
MGVTIDTDVVVVGGGLVGSASAALLARQGVAVTLVERRPSTSVHPKARLVTVRSMELYRGLGIESAVRAAGEPSHGFAVTDTLSGDLSTWIAPPADEVEAGDLSPTTPYSCDQQRLEPILLSAAGDLGADVRFGTTVVDVVERPDAVEVRVQGPDGPRVIRAQFVVAADGARSALRERLGVAMSGTEVPGRSVSAVFRADLEPALRGRTVDAVFCRAAGAFLFARGNGVDRRWQLGTYVRPEWTGRDPGDLTAELTGVLREATGMPDVQPVLEDVALWSTGAFVADRFRSGRVFLVGDAAHVMPPYGGLGGNTGVQDAHALAWMLAAVVRGDAPEPLLDRYETERRPIDRLIVDQALLRSRKAPGQGPAEGEVDPLRISLGQHYGTNEAAAFDDPARPTMATGTRAPHVALADGRSLLDRFDPRRFTVVTAEHLAVADHRLHVVSVGLADLDPRHGGRWMDTYGRATAHLVRPDGILAGAVDDTDDLGRLVDRTLAITGSSVDGRRWRRGD